MKYYISRKIRLDSSKGKFVLLKCGKCGNYLYEIDHWNKSFSSFIYVAPMKQNYQKGDEVNFVGQKMIVKDIDFFEFQHEWVLKYIIEDNLKNNLYCFANQLKNEPFKPKNLLIEVNGKMFIKVKKNYEYKTPEPTKLIRTGRCRNNTDIIEIDARILDIYKENFGSCFISKFNKYSLGETKIIYNSKMKIINIYAFELCEYWTCLYELKDEFSDKNLCLFEEQLEKINIISNKIYYKI